MDFYASHLCLFVIGMFIAAFCYFYFKQGGNLINKIEGLERLEHLTTLHLRDNQIEKLDGFSENMKQLQYVNMRGNNIADVKETSKLKCLPKMRALILSGRIALNFL